MGLSDLGKYFIILGTQSLKGTGLFEVASLLEVCYVLLRNCLKFAILTLLEVCYVFYELQFVYVHL